MIYSPWSEGPRCHNLKFFECWVSSQLFHPPLSPSKRLFSSSSLSAIRVVSPAYLRLLIFLPAILILACEWSSPQGLAGRCWGAGQRGPDHQIIQRWVSTGCVAVSGPSPLQTGASFPTSCATCANLQPGNPSRECEDPPVSLFLWLPRAPVMDFSLHFVLLSFFTVDCSPWDSPGQNTGMRSHSLL